MTRDEWNQVLDTEPVTPNQRGAIMGEFARLGIGDRGERLAVCARLLDLGELGSTRDLTQGQAGKLVGILRRIRDGAELTEITAAAVDGEQDDEHQDDEPGGGGLTWPEVITRIMVLFYVTRQGKQPGTGQGELGNVANHVVPLRVTGPFTSAPGDSACVREEGDFP